MADKVSNLQMKMTSIGFTKTAAEGQRVSSMFDAIIAKANQFNAIQRTMSKGSMMAGPIGRQLPTRFAGSGLLTSGGVGGGAGARQIQATTRAVTSLTSESAKYNKVSAETTEETDTSRNAFLFLAFGMMAAGGMMSRIGRQLGQLKDNFIETYKVIENQSVIVTTILGEQGDVQEEVYNKMIELGVKTRWTSAQAGEAMQKLAMAGLKTNEVLGAVESTLNLATVGLISTAEAADLAVGIYRGFSYEAENVNQVHAQMEHITSVLANAITHSALTMSQLADALKFVAAAAEQVGWSFESVTAAIMTGADSMVRAGIAGRGLRFSIVNLNRLAGKQADTFLTAEKALDMYNIQLLDMSGELKALPDMVDEFNEKLTGLNKTQKLAIIQQLVGTRALTLWAAMLDGTGDGLRKKEMAMKISAAREAIGNKTTEDSVDILKKWRSELGDDQTALVWLTEEMGYTVDEALNIMEVLQGMRENQELWNDAMSNSSELSDITNQRLRTLQGTTLLLKSSVDALYASFGETLGPALIWLNRNLKKLTDLVTRLPKPVRTIIAVAVLLGFAIFTVAGKIMMTVGTLFMMQAAMIAIKHTTGETVTTMMLFQQTLHGINASAKLTGTGLIYLGSTMKFVALSAALMYVTMYGAIWVTEKFGKVAGTLTFILGLLLQVKLANISLTRMDTIATRYNNVSKVTALKIMKFYTLRSIKKAAATMIETISTKINTVATIINTKVKVGAAFATGMLAAVIATSVAAWHSATAAIVANTIAILANPIGLVIVGIIALVIALYALHKNWDKLSGIMKIVLFLMTATLAPVIALYIAARLLYENWDKVADAAGRAYNYLVRLGTAFVRMINPIKQVMDLLRAFRKETDKVGDAWDGLAKKFDKLMGHSLIPEYIEAGVKRIKGSMSELQGASSGGGGAGSIMSGVSSIGGAVAVSINIESINANDTAEADYTIDKIRRVVAQTVTETMRREKLSISKSLVV